MYFSSFFKKSFTSAFAISLLVPSLLVDASSTTPTKSFKKPETSPSVSLNKIASYQTGFTSTDGGVAEIVKYNSDNQKFYLVNGKTQTIDIVSLHGLSSSGEQNLQKETSIQIADSVNSDSFTYGDVTSIDIHTKRKIIVAAVQEKDYTKPGKIVVMDYKGNVLQTFAAGIQPDMVKISSDGRYILTANEGEPRQGLANGIDPEGSVTIIQLNNGKSSQVQFSDSTKIADDVHIRNNAGKSAAVRDFEPEYIALSEDGTRAYVTLQENNAIATIHVPSGKLVSVKSLGFKDHSLAENSLDAARDGAIGLNTLPILGSYMPDGIAEVTIKGMHYLITANEGDATEWKEFKTVTDYSKIANQIVLKDGVFAGMTTSEAETKLNAMKQNAAFKKLEVLTDMGTDAVYTLGGRSFSIWKADTMELVFDSGNDFEEITANMLPKYFNWSNDDVEMDKRSAKKGPEPEDVKIGKVGDRIYAFIGLERIGGIMTYDITNPAQATFVTYTNTRDFSQAIAGDVAPEGLEFVSSEASPTRQPLLLVGNEVSGTVAVHEIPLSSRQSK